MKHSHCMVPKCSKYVICDFTYIQHGFWGCLIGMGFTGVHNPYPNSHRSHDARSGWRRRVYWRSVGWRTAELAVGKVGVGKVGILAVEDRDWTNQNDECRDFSCSKWWNKVGMSPAKLGTSEPKPWVLEGSSMFSIFLGGNGADIMGKPSKMIPGVGKCPILGILDITL